MQVLKFSFQLQPKYTFSFYDWSRGYVFDRLEKIDQTTFQKTIVLQFNGTVLYALIRLTKQNTVADTLPVSVSVSLKGDFNDSIHSKSITVDEKEIKKTIITKITEYLGISEDLSQFYDMLASYKNIQPYINQFKGYRLSSVLTREWMPLLAFLTTNTTVKNYYSYLKHFKLHWGNKLSFNNQIVTFLPSINDLLVNKLEEHHFRAIRLGYRSKFLPSILRKLHKFPLEWASTATIVDEKLNFLMSLPGIGSYSARTTLLYGLREYTIAFVDVYVRKVLNYFFNLTVKSENKIYHFLDDNFAPYQGLVVDWLTAIFPYIIQSKDPQIKFA